MINSIIVGGDFKTTPKPSSVINKIAAFFDGTVVNGGLPEDVQNIDISGKDLVIWAPNIDNEVDKHYPKKDVGSVLICSKVIREDRTDVDAIARIFKMNGNAVIAIYPGATFTFKLIDALGNVWYEGTDIPELCLAIINIYNWTKGSIRVRTNKSDFDFAGECPDLEKLIDLNKIVADKFESIGSRYFGNVSTRCAKMFPSMRVDCEYILVSKRNVDKKRITAEDFVKVRYDGTVVEYLGDNKPSVDTGIQSFLYQKNQFVNFMIHGHTYVEGYPYTDKYFPCGDMREAYEVDDFLVWGTGCINLTNHGFLIFANTIDDLEAIVDKMVFIPRKIGEEKVGL